MMRTIGFIGQAVSGHLNPMLAIAGELSRRGHHVVFLNIADAREAVVRSGFDFEALGEAEFPLGSVQALQRSFHGKSIRASVATALAFTVRFAAAVVRDAPAILRRRKIDCLVIDRLEFGGPIVAESLRLPYAGVSVTLEFNEADVPVSMTDWFPQRRWPWSLRDPFIAFIGNYSFQRRVGRHLNRQRARLGLGARHGYAGHWQSSLAHVTQVPEAFDFPRRSPTGLHCVGPIRAPSEIAPAFPFERLDGRPLVYASLGTLQGNRRQLFAAIADACAPLGVQLVITHGHQLADAETQGFAGDPIVVSYAPQCALLQRAALTITHAGMNTVLDALSSGVPLVAIPLAFEQPGVGARVKWHGVGEVLALSKVTPRNLRALAQTVLEQPKYRKAALVMKKAIEQAGGLARAASVIEHAFATERARVAPITQLEPSLTA